MLGSIFGLLILGNPELLLLLKLSLISFLVVRIILHCVIFLRHLFLGVGNLFIA